MVTGLDIVPVLTFKTSKGSQYWIDTEGRSQRNKSFHLGHGMNDQGLKEVYEKVLFVNNNGASEMAQTIAMWKQWWLLIKDGKVGIVTINDKNCLKIISGPFVISSVPSLEVSPIEVIGLEYNKDVDGYYCTGKLHIGNPIVDILDV